MWSLKSFCSNILHSMKDGLLFLLLAGQGRRRRCLSHKIILLATELIYGPSRDPHFIAPLSLVPPEDVSPRAHEVNNIIFPVPAELLLRLQSFFFSRKGILQSFIHGSCNVPRVRCWLSLGGWELRQESPISWATSSFGIIMERFMVK